MKVLNLLLYQIIALKQDYSDSLKFWEEFNERFSKPDKVILVLKSMNLYITFEINSRLFYIDNGLR